MTIVALDLAVFCGLLWRVAFVLQSLSIGLTNVPCYRIAKLANIVSAPKGERSEAENNEDLF
jgi:hypothetical protein